MTKEKNAIFGRISLELAESAEEVTAPAIAEMTAAEVAMVAGGISPELYNGV
jgi:hypothetical protein